MPAYRILKEPNGSRVAIRVTHNRWVSQSHESAEVSYPLTDREVNDWIDAPDAVTPAQARWLREWASGFRT